MVKKIIELSFEKKNKKVEIKRFELLFNIEIKLTNYMKENNIRIIPGKECKTKEVSLSMPK